MCFTLQKVLFLAVLDFFYGALILLRFKTLDNVFKH